MKVIQLPSGDVIVKKRRKLFILTEDLSLREVPFLTMKQVLDLNRAVDEAIGAQDESK
jgi:hypothetical protein